MKKNNWICRFLGHKLYLKTWDCGGGSVCKRCKHEEPAIKWPRPEKGATNGNND